MATPAQYVSRPSLARVVCIDGFGPYVRGASTGCVNYRWPTKDPADLLDYVLDASGAFLGVETDAIVTLDVTIQPQEAQGLTLEHSAVDGERAVLWLSGGVADHEYTVTVAVGSASGRSLLRSVILPVCSLNIVASTVPQPIVDGNGDPLADQAGELISAT